MKIKVKGLRDESGNSSTQEPAEWVNREMGKKEISKELI